MIVGLGFAAWTSVFLLRATETSGQILRTVPVADGEGGTNYAPVFTFTAADGHAYTITSGTASNPPDYESGDSVRVLYIPRNPMTARLKDVPQLWLFPLIAMPLGGFQASLGGLLLWFDRRYRRKLIAVADAQWARD